MKNIKNVIILLIILLIVLIGIIVFIVSNKKDTTMDTETPEAIEIMKNETNITESDKLIDIEDYLEVKNCVNAYLSEININNSAFYGYDESGNYTNLMSEKDINSYMYGVLSEDYINKKSININNIRDYVYKIEEDCFFTPIELLKKGNTESVKTFGVYGVIVTQEYKPLLESYMIVNIDENNNTFSVEQLATKDEINSTKVNIPTEIIEKDNNVFPELGITSEDLIQGYIDDYKRLSLAYPELLYSNFLNDEYKSKRFASLEEYKKYVNDNKDKIESIYPSKYQVIEQEEYTQYIVVSEIGEYYIFNSSNPSEYKVILDTYTIDIPQFTEKYNSSTEQQKVALNIDKFMQAINAKDYKYAYGCLADSFKNNYFKTQEEFENYAKENFYASNTVEYNEFDTQGDVYTYSVILTDKETGEQKTKTFIMQLGEGTEFKMSFDR